MEDQYVPQADAADEWVEIDEDIDPAEVEATLTVLDGLMQKCQSETIKEYLQVAHDDIADLVEWEDEAEGQAEAA